MNHGFKWKWFDKKRILTRALKQVLDTPRYTASGFFAGVTSLLEDACLVAKTNSCVFITTPIWSIFLHSRHWYWFIFTLHYCKILSPVSVIFSIRTINSIVLTLAHTGFTLRNIILNILYCVLYAFSLCQILDFIHFHNHYKFIPLPSM